MMKLIAQIVQRTIKNVIVIKTVALHVSGMEKAELGILVISMIVSFIFYN